MNEARRKKVAAIMETLVGVRVEIEEIQSEEQDAFDAMPEGLQESERGQKAEAAAEALAEALGNIEDAMNGLETAVE